MDSRIIVGALAVLISLTPGEARAAEMEIDGTWVMVSYENLGQVQEIPMAERSTHTFRKGKLTITVPIAKRDKEGTYAADALKKPKRLDMTYLFGDTVQTMQCIYELNGDTLRIARPFDGPQGPRPAEMKSNTQAQIMTLKRAKN